MRFYQLYYFTNKLKINRWWYTSQSYTHTHTHTYTHTHTHCDTHTHTHTHTFTHTPCISFSINHCNPLLSVICSRCGLKKIDLHCSSFWIFTTKLLFSYLNCHSTRNICSHVSYLFLFVCQTTGVKNRRASVSGWGGGGGVFCLKGEERKKATVNWTCWSGTHRQLAEYD